MKIKLLSASETAGFLYRCFGATRSWEDFLADMRRGKVQTGPIITPYGVRKNNGNGNWLPQYALKDIREFVLAFHSCFPSARSASRISARAVEVDPTDLRLWKHRKIPA